MYRLWAHARGIRPGHVDMIDMKDLEVSPNGRMVVQFTHPLCTGCKELTERLTADGHKVVLVDISERTDLARKYHVAVVPSAFAIEGNGHVEQRLA